MEEFKGTKGEWKAELDKSLYFKIKVEPDLYVEIYDDEYSKSGVLEANANLIAAAPELLNVLQETDKDLSILWSQVLFLEETNPIAEGLSDLIQKWRERNQQAINKALEINDKK